MDEDWRFTLSWKRTWRDRLDDLEGRDRKDPACLAYVRRNRGSSNPTEAWHWTVSSDEQRIGWGYTAEGPRVAIREAEKAWAEWKARGNSQSL